MLAVVLGAFGAHSLKQSISDIAVEIFETGVRYQFFHAFALIATGILYERFNQKLLRISGILFILGIILFSGSLYILTYVKGAVQPGFRWVGPITPIGGLLMITGWVLMIFGLRRKK